MIQIRQLMCSIVDRQQRSKSVLAAALAGAVMMASGPANALLFDADITPDTIYGSGNSNGFFTVDRNGGVEIGIRAQIPFIGLLNSNGNGTYSYSLAETDMEPGGAMLQPRRWNFDWSVNTDYDENSPTGNKIDDFSYRLGIDFDSGIGTDFLEFDPINPETASNPVPLNLVQSWDHSIGDNNTANGGGTEDTDPADYAALISDNNVAQNSWRHAFFPLHPTLTYDPDAPGIYDIFLEASDNSGVVARSQIRVCVGDVNCTAIDVPEPGTLALFAFGIVGLGYARRRRMV